MEWLTGYAVFHWIATWANPFCDVFFRAVTDLGSPTFYYLTVAPLFWVVDRRRAAVLFLLLLAGGYVNTYAKLWMNTPRPDPELARVLDLRPYHSGSNAFPSGHAQSAVLFWGYLARWVGRRWFTALMVAVMMLISFSRLYLGVHFPIDIAGGAVLGVLLLALIVPLERWAARDCATPPWAMAAIAAGTLALALTGDPTVATISGSLTGFLLGASWLPQQSLAPRTRGEAAAVVVVGLACQLALATTLGWFPPAQRGLIYVQMVLLWLFAVWVYPRLVSAYWLRPAPADAGGR